MRRFYDLSILLLGTLAFTTILWAMPSQAQVLENSADHVAFYDVGTHYTSSANSYGGPGVSGGAGDNLIRITSINSTGNGQGLCANIYVFDNAAKMEECCSCQVLPNSMMVLSVINNLTSNPSDPGHNLAAGTIRIAATSIFDSTTDCKINNASKITNSIEGDLEPELLSPWITHTEATATNNPPTYSFVTGVSSEHFVFQQAPDIGNLSTACAGIISGQRGLCSCQ